MNSKTIKTAGDVIVISNGNDHHLKMTTLRILATRLFNSYGFSLSAKCDVANKSITFTGKLNGGFSFDIRAVDSEHVLLIMHSMDNVNPSKIAAAIARELQPFTLDGINLMNEWHSKTKNAELLKIERKSWKLCQRKLMDAVDFWPTMLEAVNELREAIEKQLGIKS